MHKILAEDTVDSVCDVHSPHGAEAITFLIAETKVRD